MLLATLQFSWTLASATSPALPGALVALDRQTHQQVHKLTRSVEKAGGWWLELEDQLLLAAPAGALERLLDAQSVRQRLPALTPDSLMLQSRACGADERFALPAIANAGRFALVWAPPRFVPYAMPDSSEWRPVQANQVLARDLRARGLLQRSKAVNPQVQQRVDLVDPQRWLAAVNGLSAFNRNSFGSGIDDARDWLSARFGENGLQVQWQTFTASSGATSTQLENVIGRLEGRLWPDQWLVVGAHYDSRNTDVVNTSNPAPGAEDNASGCAGVLELARVFARFRPDRSMLFMCFGGEEQGLDGSTAYVQQLLTDNHLGKVQLALTMDMIGYSGDADLDAVLETSSALASVLPAFSAAAADYAPALRIITSTTPCCSDHMPFINRAVPALLTGENDWSSYPHYHRSTDTASNINNAQAMGGGILKMNVAALAQAAGMQESLLSDGLE